MPGSTRLGRMRRWLLCLMLWLLCALVPVAGQADPPADRSPAVMLSAAERAYLNGLAPVTVCPDPDWIPYEHMDAQGNFTGIAADLLELAAARLGLEMVYVKARDWEQALELSRAGEVVILPFLNRTPAREEWLVFTEPLLVDPSVFITREEHPFITDARALDGKTLVLPAGTSTEELLRRDFPEMIITHAATEREVFEAIVSRRADVTIRSLTMAAHTIRNSGLFNLKIAGQAPSDYDNHLRMGVLKGEPLLRDLLNRGIATITPQERTAIVNRHVNITVLRKADYAVALRVAGVLLLLAALSFYWNMRLKQTNAALRESERSKSVLLSNLPGIAYRCRDDSHWTMEFISEGCMALTGYRREDLVGNRRLSFNDVIVSEDRERVRREWDAAAARRATAKIEYRITTAQGERKWVYEQGVPVFDAGGKLLVIEGMIIDMTERQRLEDQLARQHAMQHLLAAISADFIQADPGNIDEKIDGMLRRCGEFMAVDRACLFQFFDDGRLVSHTHEWCAPGTPSVKDSLQAFPVAAAPWLEQIVESRGMLCVPDVAALPADGPVDREALLEYGMRSIILLPLLKDGRFLGYFGVNAVSEKRELSDELVDLLRIVGNILADALAKHQYEEELLQARRNADAASAAKSRFLANMSHEIRTPLNGIIGFADLLAMDIADQRQREQAAVIAKSGKTLLNLINDILDLSRIEAGKLTVVPAPFAPLSLLREIVGVFEQVAAAKSLTLTLAADPSLPEIILQDESRLRQILVNLVGNAVKFTEHGSVTLQAHAQPLAWQTDDLFDVSIAVIDTGVGVSAAFKPQVFGTFEQQPGLEHAAYGGAGLGLAISQNLAQLMNGEITVADNPAGRGSVFTLTLRAVRSVSTHLAGSATPTAAALPPASEATAGPEDPLSQIGLLAAWVDELEDEVRALRRTLRINRIKPLGERLIALGDQYGAGVVVRLGQELVVAAGNFQAGKLQALLGELTDHMARIRGSL